MSITAILGIAAIYFAIGGICAGGYVEVHRKDPNAHVVAATEASEIFFFWPLYLSMWIGFGIVKVVKRVGSKE